MVVFKESVYENKYLRRYVKNIEESKNIGSGSSRKIEWVCPNCKNTKMQAPNKIKTRGFNCNICSKNESYSERLMEELLKLNNENYEKQKRFDGCKNKSYLPFDFAIYNEDGELLYLVEMEGAQHYEDRTNSKWDFESIKRNDNIKREFCKKENINLIEIDSSISDFNFIIKNIKETELNYLFNNIKEKDIDKVKTNILIREYKVDIELIKELHDKGISFLSIEEKTGIKRKKIVSILKKLGVYTAREGSKNNARSVVCLNNKLLFHRMDEAIRYVGLKQQTNITAVCRGRREYCGKVNGDKARWMYYDEYVDKYGYKGLSCPLLF